MSDFHAVMMGGRSRPSQDEMVAEDFPPTQSSLHQSGALWAGERGGGGEARDFSIAPANKVERATGQMMQEMRDVTGRPQITKKSVDLASGFESIRGRVASIIAKREERIRSMRTEEDERELLEIRRPQINSVSEGLVRTTEDLFHFERRKLEKRKQAAQMKEITRAAHLAELADHFAASFKFAPEISEKSKKIAVSRRPEGETVAVGERLYSHRLQPRGDPGGEAEGGADARRSDSNQKRDRHLAECFKGNGKAKEDGGAVRVFGIVRHNCGAASPVRFSFRPQTRGVPGRPLEKSGQANSSAISQNCPVTSLQFDPSLSFLLSTLKARGQNLAT
uniref:Uncharacterized protein n=1 Tax=Chromera velia CCMP2878 TaxID=1169474 RepID=A0A0G4I6E1_9ALVE|eukprot:Cvel_11386.t1-p1 / transcript=Cvel_11386.t1 / gene=Cvel_11386 / organism=Chromera_velia_CCMP2878 / gene_product=hypothetical protein / transcript_product=hypothetical protein / location=Cvel_scaffold714:10314-16414(-) / protein_length=335 / sequence_SO=supercontig / SO=protein_coding / is_pseudo=false